MQSPSKISKVWYSPVFSELLQHRLEGTILVAVCVLQIGLHLLGLSGWVCPFKAVFGIPCPGCGLTAALDELLHGHLLASFKTHAFAPLFMVAFLLLLVNILLPEKSRHKLVIEMAKLERRTGITAWVLTALMLYWCTRLFGLA
jgi:hypothetical protein